MADSIVLNDGTVVGVLESKGVYLINGELIRIPDLPAVDAVSQRPDGTIVFQTWVKSSVQYVGVGKGPVRRWHTVTVEER